MADAAPLLNLQASAAAGDGSPSPPNGSLEGSAKYNVEPVYETIDYQMMGQLRGLAAANTASL